MINNREDANSYYQQLNELLDKYMSNGKNGKIRPSELNNYLPKGSENFNKFLYRNKLKEKDEKGDYISSSIDTIFSDVIEDRVNMEKDGVLTFEKFKFFESDEFKISSIRQALYKGIEKADLNMEKALADVFDTNLSSIVVINSDKHLFKINDWNGKDINVIIYSKEDLELIKNNIVDFLYEELKSKKVLLGGIVELSLSIINSDIRFSIENKLKINEIISNLLEMVHHESFNGYEIWSDLNFEYYPEDLPLE